jgi:hypothetical protein
MLQHLYHDKRVAFSAVSFAQDCKPPRSHLRSAWASHCIVRERRDIEAGPPWADQGSPKISAPMYQPDGSWDGPSNPIPNVGSARGCWRITVQRACRLRHHRVTGCWGRGAKSASSNMSNLPWSQGSLPDPIEPAVCAGSARCDTRQRSSYPTSPGPPPESGYCNTP